MPFKVDVPGDIRLADYEAHAHLATAVRELRAEAAPLAARLAGRTVWMVNSTAQGGGVAEMLPTMVTLFRDLGIQTEWAVIETDRAPFFDLTKRLHNALHGAGNPVFGAEDRAVYEAVNRENAERMREWFRPGDILAVHDPQPMALAGMLAPDLGLRTLWRCHIGLDEINDATRAGWEFLRPYAAAYEHAIFSAPEYIPGFLATKASVVHPAVNPLTHKNRELSVHKIAGVLTSSALASNPGPVLADAYPWVAQRLLPGGQFAPANMTGDIGLLTRPIVTQISRWDRLKGFAPLMRAFARLKADANGLGGQDGVHRRRLGLVRLVLAGPDPSSIADDPEGIKVLDDLKVLYGDLPAEAQRDIAILALPMENLRENALMVNAIQRTSSVVVQNSIREGFGLTVTEAMWKGLPVLSNRQACGPRQQVVDGVHGRMIADPEDDVELAHVLNEMLAAPGERDAWGRAARRRAYDDFLIFSQVRRWLRVIRDQPRYES